MAGTILVPTPDGLVPMTLAQARQYEATHRYAATDPNNPNLTPELRAQIQDPRVQAALQRGDTETVDLGNGTQFHVANGQITAFRTGGSPWTKIAVAGAVAATGGLAGAYVAGAGPFAAEAGGAGTAGTSGAVGTSGADAGTAGVLPATATVPTSTGTVAGLSGGTGVGADAATGLAPLAATQTVPNATSTLSGLTPPTIRSSSNVLSGLGNWLTGSAGSTLIGTAGQLIGADIGAKGYTEAAKIQADTAAKALAYEKQRDDYLKQLEASRYSDLTQRLQPYMTQGTTTGDALAKMLGVNPASYQYGTAEGAYSGPGPVGGPPVPAPSPYPAAGPSYQTRTGLDTSQAPVGTAIPRPGGPLGQYAGLVTMKAPDGSTKQVPPETVSHYQQLGAQVVG